jgi:hypothetical protein
MELRLKPLPLPIKVFVSKVTMSSPGNLGADMQRRGFAARLRAAVPYHGGGDPDARKSPRTRLRLWAPK